jgi:hypothetical protein
LRTEKALIDKSRKQKKKITNKGKEKEVVVDEEEEIEEGSEYGVTTRGRRKRGRKNTVGDRT